MLVAILLILLGLAASMSQPKVWLGCPPGQMAVHVAVEGGDKVECVDETV